MNGKAKKILMVSHNFGLLSQIKINIWHLFFLLAEIDFYRKGIHYILKVFFSLIFFNYIKK